MSLLGTVSFASSAVAFGAVTVILLLGQPRSERASWVIAATAYTVIWGVVGALMAFRGSQFQPAAGIIDALHGFVWAAGILSFLGPSSGSSRISVRRALGVAAAVAAVWVVIAAVAGSSSVNLAMIVLAVIGLLSLEQVYRNAAVAQQGTFRLLAIAVGGIFVADLFVFSQAALLDGPVRELWEGRGLFTALLAPLIVMGLKEHPEWERGLFISRQVAFYTASLLGVGGYLLAMALIAALLRAAGGVWSLWFELVFLIAAALVLLLVLFSRGLKARLKVSLVKHFYRSKYDYRAEWLRLTDRLARAGDLKLLSRAALSGICRIVGSERGHLWLTRDGKRYDWQLSLPDEDPPIERFLPADHRLPEFLGRRNWVIDSEEYAHSPDHYDSAFGPPEDGLLPARSLIVPLDCRGALLGFVAIERPAGIGRLNFDDHDILKTAGKQVAAFFAQTLAQEQLTETREFEAMNKLSTFLMHDLKNLIAQQELIVRNAQRFGDRPEFIRDAIDTIRSGVDRMKNVVGQLRGGALQARVAGRTDISKVLFEVRSRCADREPVPIVVQNGEPVRVSMDRDKLISALTHLIRNAQDATPSEGRIEIRLSHAGDRLQLDVEDSGEGMTPEFVRDHLFRPFDSTKGAEGMGIGAYQVRELVRAAGGQVLVRSQPGHGTCFTLMLPCEPLGAGEADVTGRMEVT